MNLPKTTKVKVLKACNIYNEARKAGDELLADDNTAANLVRKGILEIVETKSKK